MLNLIQAKLVLSNVIYPKIIYLELISLARWSSYEEYLNVKLIILNDEWLMEFDVVKRPKINVGCIWVWGQAIWRNHEAKHDSLVAG